MRLLGCNQLLEACADLLMGEKFAAVGGRQTLFHFADEPLIVIHKALDGFPCEQFGIAATVGGNSAELALHIRVKVNVHVFKGKERGGHCQSRQTAIDD